MLARSFVATSRMARSAPKINLIAQNFLTTASHDGHDHGCPKDRVRKINLRCIYGRVLAL